MKRPYRTSPIARRTPEQMAELLGAILGEIESEEGQMTIRHLFYRLANNVGIIPKTERAYKTLCGHLAKWRRSEEIPWDAFSDSTRWHIQPPTFDNPLDAWRRTCESYRRDLWATQDWYCEVWCEKDAISGIISRVTRSFGVPLFICRGFPSLSSMFSASQTFRQVQDEGNKAVVIYHLADYDPSGHAAADAIENAFEDDFNVGVNFERIAILPEHIEDFDLPTRPVKKSTHAHSWEAGEGCVELDAMRPGDLRQLVEDAITSRIDQREWKALQRTERIEREAMEAMDLTRLLKTNGGKRKRA